METEISFGSVQTQEAAEPADVESQAAADDTGENGAGAADRPAPGRKGNQDSAIASAAAAARRQAESKYREMVQQHVDSKERFARSHGFASWGEMERSSMDEQFAKGMTPQALDAYVQRAIEDNPVIVQAREQKAKAEVQGAMDDFAKQFPDSGITQVADFLDMPNYDTFYEYVGRGLSFSEAYLLVNRDAIVNQKAAAAKQAALNAVYGKAHLRSNAGAGESDDVVVPRDTYRSYKQMMPDWTDKQIREHYKKSITEG